MVGLPGTIAIVGAGQAGSALAHGFTRNGLCVRIVTSRAAAAGEALAGAVGASAA
ncbi:MAG: NAD(P)-binding domain-containing protein, partial [Acidimicrobiia bacterium]|nr:NAD(P)-binding domain-containing protein [Acidimicrobiia bacterium]